MPDGWVDRISIDVPQAWQHGNPIPAGTRCVMERSDGQRFGGTMSVCIDEGEVS